jgi:hypothetical protein
VKRKLGKQNNQTTVYMKKLYISFLERYSINITVLIGEKGRGGIVCKTLT